MENGDVPSHHLEYALLVLKDTTKDLCRSAGTPFHTPLAPVRLA